MSEVLMRCSKCNQEKPATTDFFPCRTNGDLRKDCRECAAIRARQWLEKNKERARDRSKLYYQNNKEEIKASVRRYGAENKEKVRESRKRYSVEKAEELRVYRKKNKARRAENFRQWHLKHRDRNRLRSAYHSAYQKVYRHKRKARKLDLPDTLTKLQWEACLDYFGHTCAYCGRPVGLLHTIAVEHLIPLSSPDCPGTTALNCVPACHGIDGCNNSKHNKPADEWLESKFGKRKATAILARVDAYFAWVKSQSD